MRIRAERDDLADVFTRANRAVGARSALPVLQGLLCEVRGDTLRVTGTDLEMTVRTQTEVEVMEEGSVVISGKLLSDAVRKLPPGAVTIGTTDSDIEIIGRGPRFTLRQLSLDDFPVLEDTPVSGTEVDGDALVPPRPMPLVPSLPGCCSNPATKGCEWWRRTPTGWPCATFPV